MVNPACFETVQRECYLEAKTPLQLILDLLAYSMERSFTAGFKGKASLCVLLQQWDPIFWASCKRNEKMVREIGVKLQSSIELSKYKGRLFVRVIGRLPRPQAPIGRTETRENGEPRGSMVRELGPQRQANRARPRRRTPWDEADHEVREIGILLCICFGIFSLKSNVRPKRHVKPLLTNFTLLCTNEIKRFCK